MCALKRPGHAVVLRTDASPEKGGLNSGNYNDLKVGKLIETARHTSDPAARIKLYEKIDRILHDDAPWIFVASGKQNAVTWNKVHGLELQTSFQLLLKRNTIPHDPYILCCLLALISILFRISVLVFLMSRRV